VAAIQDNYPDMEMTCLDLSPFYLAKARENLKYWRSKRAPGSIDTDTFIQVHICQHLTLVLCRLPLNIVT
jgi:hypothetical protein